MRPISLDWDLTLLKPNPSLGFGRPRDLNHIRPSPMSTQLTGWAHWNIRTLSCCSFHKSFIPPLRLFIPFLICRAFIFDIFSVVCDGPAGILSDVGRQLFGAYRGRFGVLWCWFGTYYTRFLRGMRGVCVCLCVFGVRSGCSLIHRHCRCKHTHPHTYTHTHKLPPPSLPLPNWSYNAKHFYKVLCFLQTMSLSLNHCKDH